MSSGEFHHAESPLAAAGLAHSDVDDQTLLTTPAPLAASTVARSSPNERYAITKSSVHKQKGIEQTRIDWTPLLIQHP
jgi:hypothetical protein